MANQYLKLPSTIVDATDVGSGTVNNTEFGYLDGVTSSIQTQINTANTDILDAKKDDQFLRILGALGSDIKGLSFGCGYPSDNFIQFADNYIHLTAVWLPFAATLTGVKYYVSQQGVFTEDNENRIGLYTWSSGTLTLVASSVNDANIWKAVTGFATKAFSSTYAASAGLYFVGGLYNYSAQTTAPRLATGGTILFAAVTTLMGMANTSKVSMNQNPHNTLPSSITVSATSNQSQNIWFALY